MASSWPRAEIWLKLDDYSSQEKGDSCECCLWDYDFNIACMVNSAVIKAGLCHKLLYSPLLKVCLWAVRERWIAWIQNQLTVRTRTYLFPHRRISKMNVFFSFLKKMFIFCQLSLFRLCCEALMYHLHHGLVSLSRAFAPTPTTAHPLKGCSPGPWEVLSALPSAAFQGRIL